MCLRWTPPPQTQPQTQGLLSEDPLIHRPEPSHDDSIGWIACPSHSQGMQKPRGLKGILTKHRGASDKASGSGPKYRPLNRPRWCAICGLLVSPFRSEGQSGSRYESQSGQESHNGGLAETQAPRCDVEDVEPEVSAAFARCCGDGCSLDAHVMCARLAGWTVHLALPD